MLQPEAPGEAEASASQDPDGSRARKPSQRGCLWFALTHTWPLGLSLWEEAEAEEMVCSQLSLLVTERG